MTIAYLGLGSNLGDRVGYVQQALTLLADCPGIGIVEASSLYETEPVGFADQEWFINAAVAIETSLSPVALLTACQEIERRLLRQRDPANRNGPRTLDIDILFYGDLAMASPALTIPHPRVHLRAYALVPMLEVNAELRHPVLGKTIEELHEALDFPEEVLLYGTRR
ncbi:MAG: 2-amino-4-hydroxy-6-hydroxymethyldihydropteridine diphosphokinase [Vampirovibrionales bacterium]|nr:2-amino-4-hydroxy-6-hydroxymethyldihydropteridine diphosphokinase [Vampirovibrionales bacterium]